MSPGPCRRLGLRRISEKFLVGVRDLAEYYTSESKLREELSREPEIEEHTTTAVELWQRARQLNEEVIDGHAVHLANETFAAATSQLKTTDIISEMKPSQNHNATGATG